MTAVNVGLSVGLFSNFFFCTFLWLCLLRVSSKIINSDSLSSSKRISFPINQSFRLEGKFFI